MADRQRTEINAELLRVVRLEAERQGRPEAAVLEEAVVAYLSARYPGTSWEEIASEALGANVAEVHIGPSRDRPRGPLPALLNRMSSRFDLDEDEAMRMAVEEQHAFREERKARRGAEG